MSLFAWLSGFFEEGAPQSSTRVGALALVLGSIAFAFKYPQEPVTLGVLLSAAATFCGLKLAKDLKSGGESPE